MSSDHYVDNSCKESSDELYLIKLPKHVAEYWKNAPDGENVAIIENLINEEKIILKTKTKTGVPRNFTLNLNKIDRPDTLISKHSDNEHKLIGKIVSKIETTPYIGNNNNNSRELDKTTLLKVKKSPQKTVQQLDSILTGTIKPVSAFKEDLEYVKKKKEVGKRVRMDRHEVKDLLFQAFNQNPYYRLKDLLEITNQPIDHLKDILKEICIFRTKEPNKNMWELKSQYKTRFS